MVVGKIVGTPLGGAVGPKVGDTTGAAEASVRVKPGVIFT